MFLLGTRDPRKTTGLIGRTCKCRNAFSEAVRTVDDFVMPTGIRWIRKGTWHWALGTCENKPASLPAFRPSPKDSRVTRSIAFDFSHSHTPLHEPSPAAASNPRPDRSYAAGDGNAAPGFVGDVRSRDTPDPIPNSEVKSRPPMILQRGKVGHCRLQRPDSGKPGSGLLHLREDSSADYADSADGKGVGGCPSPSGRG